MTSPPYPPSRGDSHLTIFTDALFHPVIETQLESGDCIVFCEMSISLREVQHVIAREYGLKSWEVLQVIVEVDFDLLEKLDNRSAEMLLREVSREDCIIALKTASEEVKEKLLGNISPGYRNLIESEVGFLENRSGSKYALLEGKIKTEEIQEAQRRILQQLAQSAEAGDLVF